MGVETCRFPLAVGRNFSHHPAFNGTRKAFGDHLNAIPIA
jgi:hypothetical protein